MAATPPLPTTLPPAVFDALIAAIQPFGVVLQPAARLDTVTTFRLGGPCPLLVTCTSADQVIAVVRRLQVAGLPYRLIGGGSNLLVSDHGLPEIVVRYVAPSPDAPGALTFQDDPDPALGRVTVCAGVALDTLAARCCDAGLGGMVNTSGIPGTVGGAVVGNAGAWGWQVADALVHVEILRHDGEILTVPRADLGFAYRHSDLKITGDIVLAATFALPRLDADDLRRERVDIIARRAEKHPNLTTHPCAGSFFRNIEPSSAADRRQAAGFFLEQAGAKSLRVGGAAVFTKHANIIVKATAECRAQDVYDLSHAMAAAVQAMHGLALRPEVLALGEFAASPSSPAPSATPPAAP